MRRDRVSDRERTQRDESETNRRPPRAPSSEYSERAGVWAKKRLRGRNAP
jgi:hypothetical protein